MSQAISSTSYSSSLPSRPLLPNLPRRHCPRGKISCATRRDSSFGHNYDGKLVDEDMIVLRRRIREVEMSDVAASGDVAPSDWMEWEKKYYVESYDSDICEGVGFLQSQLMSTRPSLAFAILALFSLSLPISMGFVLLHLVDVAMEVIVRFHF